MVMIGCMCFYDSKYETVTLSKPKNSIFVDRGYIFTLKPTKTTYRCLQDVVKVHAVHRGPVNDSHYALCLTFVNNQEIKVLQTKNPYRITKEVSFLIKVVVKRRRI